MGAEARCIKRAVVRMCGYCCSTDAKRPLGFKNGVKAKLGVVVMLHITKNGKM
jgi:hypothetical protein